MTDSLILNSTAREKGGCLLNAAGETMFSGCTIDRSESEFSDGGVIFTESGRVTVANSTITRSVAQSHAGIAYVSGGAVNVRLSSNVWGL